ncbi:MAG: transporter substrate-binding domain-containing protein [Clostridia bacterium]|nr:transporter substrate-binding domain-containing protein [Clostridia bacterium]
MKKTERLTAVTLAAILALTAATGLLFGCTGGEKTGEDAGEKNTYISGKPSGIELDISELSLGMGEIATIKATVPTDGNYYTDGITWTSSDENIATVESGIVTASVENFGKTMVTARVNGTSYSASCLVTVTNGETLTVGVKNDVRNFGYYDYATREYSGMEIDLTYALATELCYDGVELVPVDPDERETDLISGDVDIIVATYTVTEEREEKVNFSSPYYTDSVQILLGEQYSSLGLSSLSELSRYLEGKKYFTVGTVENSTAYDAFVEYCEGKGIEKYSPFLGGEIFINRTYADYESLWEALQAGEIDAFVADHSILQSYSSGSYGYKFLDDEFSDQDYAVGTAKDEDTGGLTKLGEKVNDTVDRFLSDGTIDALLEKYGLA